MGSKGSTTQVTNQNAYYKPSPQITAAGTQALQGGQAAAQQPFWLPQQPLAGFTPDQLAAFQNVRNMQGMSAPWFGQAGNLAMQSATPLTGQQIGNFYNPMAQNVTNQLQNIFGQQMRETTGKATQAAGGVGADRIAVAQANLANQQGLAAGQTYADLWQRALAAAQQNQQMQANAAYGMGNLGQGAQQSALQATQALGGIGGQQQAFAQSMLNAPYSWLGQQFAYPYQANQYLAGVTGALVPAFPSQTTGQSTTTTTPPAPSPISQAAGLGMAAYGAYNGKGSGGGGMSPYMPFGGGSAGAIYRHGGGVPYRADGGQTKAPEIPQMGAGTSADMDKYFSNINKQAQDLSAMSRYAMQPTGTGGWTSPFFGNMFPQRTGGKGSMGGVMNTMTGGMWDQLSQNFPGESSSPGVGQYNYNIGGRTGYAIGGGDDEGIGEDPFGDIRTGVPKVKLSGAGFHPPELPKPPAAQQSSGSGKGSEMGTIGTAIGTAAKFLPLLLAQGGAVSPFSRYQHFQYGGGDDLGDIADFPFTPPEPPALSPEEMRPPVPPPFPGLKGPFRGGVTPQEAELAAASKAKWASQAENAGVPADFPYETAGAEAPSPPLPRLPAAARKMTYETAGAAAPEPPPGIAAGFGKLPEFLRNAPSEINRWAATKPMGAGREAAGEAAAFLPERAPDLAPNEALNQPPSGGPAAAEAAAFQPPQTPFAPLPSGVPAAAEAAAFQPETAPALPRPRPDIAGAPGQGVPRVPVVPASRQSIAQDVMYYANQHGIPIPLAMRLINQESGFNPRATSSAGAIGVAQLMPGTARELGVNPYDTSQNIEGGMRYLRKMYDRYGDWKLAAAAYNAGPQRVDAFIAGRGSLPAETRAYVPAVTGGLDLSAKAGAGAELPPGSEDLRMETPAGAGPGAGPGPTALAPSGIPSPAAAAPSGIDQYRLPAGETPFPQAGPQAPGAAAARNPWLMAGLSVMGGTSPYPLVNIGKGVASSLEKQREEATKEVPINQAAQRLYLEMQKHVDSMTKLSAAQQLEALKPFRYGTDPETGLEMYAVRHPTTGTLMDTQTGKVIQLPGIGGPGAAPPAAAPAVSPTSEARDSAVEKFTKQDEGTKNQYAAPELAPNLVPEKQPGGAMLKGPFAQGEASTIRQYNQDINKKVRPALDFQREQITRLKLDYATIMKDEGENFFTRMAQLPGNPSAEGRVAAMRTANNVAIAARKPPPFDPAKIAAMEEVIKIQNTMGMSFAATISPRDSQQMQMAAIASQPGLTQSPQGFQRLIGLYDGATARGEERIRFWNRWQQVNPHRYAGYDEDFETKNPIHKTTVRALVENSPYPQAKERFPEAVKYLREHKDDAAYKQKFDKVYGGTSSYFLTGVLDPYAITKAPQ